MDSLIDGPTIQEEGTLELLNVGAGHIKVSMNNTDPVERERAKAMVTDMLQRGYAIFVEIEDGELAPVKRFDPKKEAYIITDVPRPVKTDTSIASPVTVSDSFVSTTPTTPTRKNKRKEREVSMVKGKATAVGRSAGG